MDTRLLQVLDSLLINMEVLNGEVARLLRNEQLTPGGKSLQMIERIRGECTASLQNLRTVERQIYKRRKAAGLAEPAKVVRLEK